MSVANYPWKQRGLNIFAPIPEDVDRFCDFIENELVPDGIDTILLIIRYNYMFESHPECRGEAPLTKEDVKKMLSVCRKHNIELIPDMNLLGHQTVQEYSRPDGLLKGHPEFSETPIEEKPEYCYSLCPTHPDLYPLVIDRMDEVMDAFEAKYMHIGIDEVFYIGMCDRCKATGKTNGQLLADWCNKLAAHIKSKGAIPMMWGDRLLNAFDFGYGPWDASQNETWTALDMLDKDFIITDWHYHCWSHFRSVEVFAKAGLKIWLSTFNIAEYAKMFLDYAKEHGDENLILGVMETTWVPARCFMDGMEGKEVEEDGTWHKDGMRHIERCYNWLFRPEKFDPSPIHEEE